MLTDGPFHGEGGCLPTSSLQLCCLQVKNPVFVQPVLILLFLLLPPSLPGLCATGTSGPKGLKDCVLWLCHAETLLFTASLMCGKFGERDVGLKEEENCFIDAFFFF